jgi:membrane fusion protein (multidrug efflux system)
MQLTAAAALFVSVSPALARMANVEPTEQDAKSGAGSKTQAPKSEQVGNPAREKPAKEQTKSGGMSGGPPPAKVRLDAVRLETVERWREVTGELRAARRTTVAAEENGQVERIDVEGGDQVTEGQTLARQDSALAKIEVARTQANLATKRAVVGERQAALTKARRDLRLISDSFEKSGSTETERDDAATAVAEAEAKLAESQADTSVAQAELERAQSRLEKMTITAPFSGTVVRKHTEAGQWLSAGDDVVELVQIDVLDAWLDVPENTVKRLAPKITEGAPGAKETAPASEIEVIVRVDALPEPNREFRAKVAGIIPAGDPLSRLFPVRVRIDNKSGDLRPGMSVAALVPTGKNEEALTISRDALLRSETGAFVYFDSGGTAAVAPVTTLYAVTDRLVIQSPVLKAGMRVVIEGNERMFPGQPLLEIGAPPPTDPAATSK